MSEDLLRLGKMNQQFPGLEGLMAYGLRNAMTGKGVQNEDGSFSDIGLEVVEVNGDIVLMPSVYKGKRLSPEQMQKVAGTAKKDAEYPYPKFATRAQAESVRDILRKRMAGQLEFARKMGPPGEALSKMLSTAAGGKK